MFWFLLFPVDNREPLEVTGAIQSIKYLTGVDRATNMWAARGLVRGPSFLLEAEAELLHNDTVKQRHAILLMFCKN